MSSGNKEIWKKIEDYDYKDISDAIKLNGFEIIKNWLKETL